MTQRSRLSRYLRCSISILCNSVLVGIVLALFCASSLRASDTPRRPKVRAITAFIRIDRDHYSQQIAEALTALRQAKASFETGGYEVQTIRITTQPFPQYVHGLRPPEALQFFKALDALSAKEGFLLDIGPALQSDADDPVHAELLGQILAATSINGSVIVAAQDGIHWKSIRSAVKVMKYLEGNSPGGENNFGFAATAMLLPYAPFFPGSYHDGPGRQFSVGLEAANFVADTFEAGKLQTAQARLSDGLAVQARLLDAIANQIQKSSGWTYLGLDASPAPSLDSSIGAAIEKVTGEKFGSAGTLTAARIITEAMHSIPVKRVGYSGLMLPPLEDPVLAQRWSEGTYNMDSVLAYSAVCGTGLDTIPLPGDTSEEQLEKIIGDVASLALKWNKPLTARMILAPGKKAGEHTNFTSPHLTNTTLRAF
ncbi:MAG TPA: DUF711 family protein [Terriglobales bacterium]|nr:DUF711 family protein [Terriglobales bacterium]